MQTLIERLNALPLAGLLLVTAVGFSLGRVAIRGIGLGPGGATLLLALGLGHLGLGAGRGEATEAIAGLGFALFIYSVGFDAAPRCATCFRSRLGWHFMAVAIVVNAAAVLATWGAARSLGLSPQAAAGLLAGALTSPQTFAAASRLSGDVAEISVVFALTFPLGLTGVVLLVQLVPRLVRSDLTRGAASDDEEYLAEKRGRPRFSGGSPEVTRAFRVVEEAVVGKSLRALDLTHRTGCVLSRIHRAGSCEVEIALAEAELARDDVVIATGRRDELQELQVLLGPEVFDQELEDPRYPTRRVLLRDRRLDGQTLAQADLSGTYSCLVLSIERGDLVLEPAGGVVLHRGDILEVVGPRQQVRALAQTIGRFEPRGQQTDIALYSGGIALGLILGQLSFEIGGVRLGPGPAGALLLVGLLLGSRRRLGPWRTYVPFEARQLVRDLGILLFVGVTGLRAGHHLEEGVAVVAPSLFVAGFLVNAVVVTVALLVARLLLRLSPLDAWGSLSGGLTSSAALMAVRRASDSNDAALSYVIAFAFASILATLAGPLLVFLVGG